MSKARSSTGIRRRDEDAFLIVLNAHHEIVGFHPPGDGGGKAVDAAVRYSVRREPEKQDFAIGHCYNAAGRSFLLSASQAHQ